jgi:RimJ/RimL family protein N-acetyltransferase
VSEGRLETERLVLRGWRADDLDAWNPEGWPGLELGWTLARDAWGQGYASEAAGAAMAWAWTELGAPELISLIDPGNAASLRVAERLGMCRSREQDRNGKRILVFAIERPSSP